MQSDSSGAESNNEENETSNVDIAALFKKKEYFEEIYDNYAEVDEDEDEASKFSKQINGFENEIDWSKFEPRNAFFHTRWLTNQNYRRGNKTNLKKEFFEIESKTFMEKLCVYLHEQIEDVLSYHSSEESLDIECLNEIKFD